MKKRLLLVPAPLDFGCEPLAPITDVLPAHTLASSAQVTHWIVENAKTARAVIKRIGEVTPLAAPIQQHVMTELPREVHKKGDHGTPQQAAGFDAKPMLQSLIAQLGDKTDIGLMCEAGLPAIADPGSSVVRAAHALGLEVVPLVGPSSLLMALAASGLSGQHFAFVGYLPIDSSERVKRIQALESLALKTGQTQLFIEVPHRNAAMHDALLKSLQANTRLLAASGLSLQDASIRCDTAAQWRAQPSAVSALPTVFGIGP
jgi:16S rRNA (cytidine1402-2'-O)-methyltransferase